MSSYQHQNGKWVEGELCSNCHKFIEGKIHNYKNRGVLFKDGKITGVCVGIDWIEYWNCKDCYMGLTLDQLTQDRDHNIQLVINLANQCYPDNQVLADLTACQAILESGLQNKPSNLALKYNNLFGIKGRGTHGVVYLPTHEFEGGEMVTTSQPFASNNTLLDSFEQHKELLDHNRYKPVRDAKTFEEAARAIREAGYATDPSYTVELNEVYNKWVKDD